MKQDKKKLLSYLPTTHTLGVTDDVDRYVE